MTEAQLQDVVIDAARILSWRVAHFRPAKTALGWRTAVAGDGAGFPDLVLVRAARDGNGRVLFVELKAPKGRVSREQEIWLDSLRAASFYSPGVEVHVWRPADWHSGLIERVLRHPTLAGADQLRDAA